MNRKICVLASDSVVSRALISALARELPVVAVIVEESGSLGSAWRLLRYRLKRLGLAIVLGQLLFVAYDRLWLRRTSQLTIRSILRTFGEVPPDIPWHVVPTINSPEVTELVRGYGPAISVVTGTSIIKPKTLAELPPLINIHCGITPAYRGVHGGFWAVHQNDYANLGVTVHRVDAGVDTGAIIAQAPITIDPGEDNIRTIVAKQYAAGIPLLVRAVREALNGTVTVIKQDDLPDRQWFAPTLLDYLRFRRMMRTFNTDRAER